MHAPALPLALPVTGGVQTLTDWAAISAQGEDTAAFLQGQLTNDVQSMAPGEARWAGYCSAKGRLLATFLVWRRAADAFTLLCSADLQPAMLKRLRMFVLRAKCQLGDAAGSRQCWGLLGPAGQALGGEDLAPMRARVGEAVDLVRLPDSEGVSRWVAWTAPDASPAGDLLPAGLWDWLEVRSGIARVNAANSEAFVPQMVNLELVGGVSFKKGCYPGQEVVARSQYRGTLKRRALLWHAEAPMSAGQEVFHSADPEQPAGRVVLAAPAPGGGWDGLIEVKLEALGHGGLHLGTANGVPLQALPLPYELPRDAA